MPRASRSDSRLDTGLFLACLGIAGFAVILPPSLRDPAASALRGTIVAPLVSLQATAERGRNALATHDALVRQRDSLALLAQGTAMLEADNARLRAQLGLAGDLAWGFVSADALHGRGPGDDDAVLLTAGADVGVRPFSPVLAPQGLVGMVLTVDAAVSQAILWSHPDFRVSAMSVDGGAFGIVRAHRGGGASRWLLEMNGIPFRQQLAPGTRIVSSGLGGTYPRGIPVGTVLEELRNAEGYARSYLVRPAVTPSDVASLIVLLPPRAKAGVDSIWQRPDSAAAAAPAPVAPEPPR